MILVWRNRRPILSAQLSGFETKFGFRICGPMRTFLLENNAGFPTPGLFPTTVRERKLSFLLDFSNTSHPDGAWAINARLRNQIGPKRIIIGRDTLGNYVCIEREHKQQRIVLWNHVTNDFELCLWDIPMFLRYVA